MKSTKKLQKCRSPTRFNQRRIVRARAYKRREDMQLGKYRIYHTYEEDMHPYILRYRGYSEA